MTAPYDPRAQTELTRSIQHVHSVWAYDAGAAYNPIELALVSGTLNFDEDRAPYAVLSASMQIPSQATLDFLDPRKNIRIFVLAGYVYEDGQRDIQKICDLGLRSRVVRRPQGDLVIEAASDEMRVQDFAFTTPRSWDSTVAGGTAIHGLLSEILGNTYRINVMVGGQTFVKAGEIETLEPGGDVWGQIQSIADRAGARVYADQGVFWIVNDTSDAGAAVANFRTGESGTITGSESSVERERFANMIIVTYTGGALPVTNYAEVTDGPYGTATVKRVVKTVELDVAGDARDAGFAASVMLSRAITRGRSMSLEVAAATYWVRPTDTVTVQLPTGPQERHLVSSVEFDIPTGTMNLKTRQPENVVIKTGE